MTNVFNRVMRIFMNDDIQKIAVAKRIKSFREHLGMDQAQFAEYLGMGDSGQSTISKWERQKQIPGTEHAAKLADKSGQSPLYWIGLEPVEIRPISPSMKMVPLVGEIQAGNWRESIADAEPMMVPLPPTMVASRYNVKAFLVRGNSMDRIYPDGSYVFIAGLFDNPIEPVSGNIVLVQRRNQKGWYEATLKEMVVDPNGKKWLWPRSNDPEHQSPIQVENGAHENEDVLILGVVKAAIVAAP